jgi:hypothetical protein
VQTGAVRIDNFAVAAKQFDFLDSTKTTEQGFHQYTPVLHTLGTPPTSAGA